MARFVDNMAASLEIGVRRHDNKWYDLYDIETELRAGLEEVVRVTIYNRTSQRAAYNLKVDEKGHGRKSSVKLGMLALDTNGKPTGQIQPIATGRVNLPTGETVDISIAPKEAAVLEFAFTWVVPGGASPEEPVFTLGAFAGGTVQHIKTSENAGKELTASDWA